jgi:S-adenosylhomocysteine hydrolase
MDYDYPLLHKVFSHYKNIPHEVDDVYLVCCQHLLEPQLKMFELLIDFGFNPEKIIVLGKIYSSNTGIITGLQDRGIKVLQPTFSGISFDEEHSKNCKMIFDSIPNDTQVVILDDGAEMIKTFSNSHNVLFAVEQTSSGFRKLENTHIPFPVINVARSVTKLVQESPFIGRLCYERINDYIKSKNLSNPSVLIVGLGPVGEATFEIFKQNNFSITGFDIKHGHTDLLKSIHELQSDIVIGATGSSILSSAEIEQLSYDKNLHLISVSSSDREFPVAHFRNREAHTDIHTDVQYKNITFVNNGFPITFKGNRLEGTPMEMEKTMCLLGGSVIDGVVNGIKEKGLINVSVGLEELINK